MNFEKTLLQSSVNFIAQRDEFSCDDDSMINHILCHRISNKIEIISSDKCWYSKDAFEIMSSASKESCYIASCPSTSRWQTIFQRRPKTYRSFKKCILSISRQWNGFWWRLISIDGMWAQKHRRRNVGEWEAGTKDIVEYLIDLY